MTTCILKEHITISDNTIHVVRQMRLPKFHQMRLSKFHQMRLSKLHTYSIILYAPQVFDGRNMTDNI